MSNFRRFRHNRVDETARTLNRETVLYPEDFIWPLFCVEGANRKEEVSSMPGVYRMSTDLMLGEIEKLTRKGLSSVLLFGVPDVKGVENAASENGVVQLCIPEIMARFPDLEIITDVCICSYTEDGHCHVGDNDLTCEHLAQIAVSHARVGAHVVAPSAMMDGQVVYIRRALDEAGFRDVKIMSYAAKFASCYYGPFRDAADCAPKKGDRATYQMDPANGDEAVGEILEDIEQGADSIIVKPALAYLDVIARARQNFAGLIAGYNVSGEYRMLLDAVENGYVRPAVIEETLLSIKRAGADRIISYFTPYILDKMYTREHVDSSVALVSNTVA